MFKVVTHFIKVVLDSLEEIYNKYSALKFQKNSLLFLNIEIFKLAIKFVNLQFYKKQIQWKTEYTLNSTPQKERF